MQQIDFELTPLAVEGWLILVVHLSEFLHPLVTDEGYAADLLVIHPIYLGQQ